MWLSHVSFLWFQALINILNQKDVESDPENVSGYLRPFRLIMSLLDKPDIGTRLKLASVQ